MKKIIILLIIVSIPFSLPFFVSADDIYSQMYEQSGAGDTQSALDDNTKNFFNQNGIDPSDYNWVNSLKTESVFSHIWNFLKSGAKAPLKSGFAALGIILIAAALRSFGYEKDGGVYIKFAVTLAIISAIISGVFSSVTAAVNTIRGGSTFMLSFVPVYMGILSVSGAPVTAAASGGMILGAAEFISGAAAFTVTSIMGSYLALSISGAVSPIINNSAMADTFKKIGMWAMSLCTTVFLGVLGVKTAVNSAADSLAVKTAKFIIGTCVPVAGAALSGAVNTVSASVSVLKSSVGIYGVVAVAIIFLPAVLELTVWRLVLTITGGVCSAFSMDFTYKTLKAVDSMISLLIGVLLLIGAMFVVSLSVTVGIGRLV